MLCALGLQFKKYLAGGIYCTVHVDKQRLLTGRLRQTSLWCGDSEVNSPILQIRRPEQANWLRLQLTTFPTGNVLLPLDRRGPTTLDRIHSSSAPEAEGRPGGVIAPHKRSHDELSFCGIDCL